MLDFLWDNKAWLFEGLGVAVIVGLGTFLYRKIFGKDKRTTSQITVVNVIDGNKQTAISSQAIPGDLAPTKVTRISPLSFEEVLATLRDAPPLQIEAIGARFKGITVQWKGQVFSIEKYDKDTVRLTLHFGPHKSGLVFCSVSLAKYPELQYLKKETPVTVQGIVEKTGGGSVTLENPELFFTG